MGFFSFLKYTFMILAAHLVTSCGKPFENHCTKHIHNLISAPTRKYKPWKTNDETVTPDLVAGIGQ
jgi:hypothetical protein